MWLIFCNITSSKSTNNGKKTGSRRMYYFVQHVAYVKIIMGNRVHAVASANVILTASYFQPPR